MRSLLRQRIRHVSSLDPWPAWPPVNHVLFYFNFIIWKQIWAYFEHETVQDSVCCGVSTDSVQLWRPVSHGRSLPPGGQTSRTALTRHGLTDGDCKFKTVQFFRFLKNRYIYFNDGAIYGLGTHCLAGSASVAGQAAGRGVTQSSNAAGSRATESVFGSPFSSNGCGLINTVL